MKISKEFIAAVGIGLMVFGAAAIHLGFGILMIGLIVLISRAYMDAEGGDEPRGEGVDWKKDVKDPIPPQWAPPMAPADPVPQPWEPPMAPKDPLPDVYQPQKGPTA